MEFMDVARWIWIDAEAQRDCHGEFVQRFAWRGGPVRCRISCDGDYALYVNGRYVASDQYCDYEHYKIYDDVELTDALRPGENCIAVHAWHFGVPSQRYRPAAPGLWFAVYQEKAVLAASGTQTLCRRSLAYESGACRQVTSQMGLSFRYDANREDGWLWGDTGSGWHAAVPVDKRCEMYPRPVERHALTDRVEGRICTAGEATYRADLGRETVGIPVFCLDSPVAQEICVSWGEHLLDGHVRRIIGDRDFSFTYVAKPGRNAFFNPMLRVGCRYLELRAEKPVSVSYLGLRPLRYPVERRKRHLEDPLDQRIYDACVDTLSLCMMEHYVDTPWREQCLYAFDSRNQMRCGYSAFEGGNARYARASLMLIAQDRRDDGLLSITSPCGVDLTIPSFSLYYFMAVREYMDHTGDVSLGAEVYPRLRSILSAFDAQCRDDLVWRFPGANHWNFYDWSPHLAGTLRQAEASQPDLMLNCLWILALRHMQAISAAIGAADGALQARAEACVRASRARFFHPESGLFSLTQHGGEYTVLGNAFAILAGLTSEAEGRAICRRFVDGSLTECSLSMKTFEYDAMLRVDEAAWAPVILAEIRRNYGKMLEQGATSVWETLEGASAFDGAGSLCHGWSAIPVYYYDRLMKQVDRGGR